MKLKGIPHDKIFFSADLHLGHKGICRGETHWDDKSKCRDFDSVEEMNNHIIENINSQVDENSYLFLNGDTLFGEKDYVSFLTLLKCKNVFLTHGNHCNITKLNLIGEKYLGSELKMLIDKQLIHMYHHPVISWDNMSKGSIMIYGHVHGSIEQSNHPVADYLNSLRALDVGIDNAYNLFGKYIPFRYDWILESLRQCSIKSEIDYH